MTKCLLLTGANGFVGSAIQKKFLNNNWQVYVLGRSSDMDVFCDFSKPTSVTNLSLPRTDFDLCIHVAAANEIECQKNSVNAYTTNCGGSEALFRLMQNLDVKKMFYISTFHVFGNQNTLFNETSTPNPSSIYGLIHRISEMNLLKAGSGYGPDVKIIRLPNIIGVPTKWHSFNRWTLAQFDFCMQCNEKSEIFLKSSGHQIRNWVSLNFITERILQFASENDDKSVCHIVGQDLSIFKLAHMIAKEWECRFGEKIEIRRQQEVRSNKNSTSSGFSTLDKNNLNFELELEAFVQNVGLKLKNAKA